MAVGDFTRYVWYGTSNLGDWQITGTVVTQVSIGDKESELEALRDGMVEEWLEKTILNDMLDFMHQTVKVEGLTLRDTFDNTVGLDTTFQTPYAGKQGGESLPPSVALYGKKLTDKVGRSFTGGRYYPFTEENKQNGGVWALSFLDDVAEWATRVLTIVGPLLLNLFVEVLESKVALAATPVTGIALAVKTASQDRRMS